MSKQWFVVLVAALALVALTGAGTCKPLPSKTWSGVIDFHPGDTRPGLQWWLQNDCNWAGQQDLNGAGAYVVPLPAKYGGTRATFTYSTPAAVSPTSVGVAFYTGACDSVNQAGASVQSEDEKAVLTIPTTARFAVFMGYGIVPGTDIKASLRSLGRTCR